MFTTGGIGPTHDDINVECVARDFGEGLVEDPEAVRRMTRDHQDELTPARRKMAMFPESATLIDNPISRAPGFSVDNVFVLAGIPSIAQAMFESLAGMLRGGPSIHSRSVDAHLSEGALAPGLGELAEASPDVEIGSYPFFRDDRYGVNVVVRSTDLTRVETVIGSVTALMRDLGGDPRPGG